MSTTSKTPAFGPSLKSRLIRRCESGARARVTASCAGSRAGTEGDQSERARRIITKERCRASIGLGGGGGDLHEEVGLSGLRAGWGCEASEEKEGKERKTKRKSERMTEPHEKVLNPEHPSGEIQRREGNPRLR